MLTGYEDWKVVEHDYRYIGTEGVFELNSSDDDEEEEGEEDIDFSQV